MKYKFYSILAVAAILAGGAFIYVMTPPAAAQAQGKGAGMMNQAAPVKTAPALRQDLPVQIQGLGTVVPLQTVAIKSRIDSQIMDVKFHDGDNVKKGDVLFVLDDRALKAQLDQAQAALASANAQLDNVRKQHERNGDLIKQSAISQKIFDDSKAALDAQIATVDSDKAAIESLQVQLSYTVIKAPIDGRTGTVNVTVGNNVKANDTAPLVTINQIKPIQVQASLPQDSFDALRQAVGAGNVPVTATRSNSNTKMTGSFAYIDNTIDQSTGTFIGRAVFPNDDESLWPGMLVNLTIDVGQDKQALIIPNVAVQTGPAGSFVYVIENNKARKAMIKVERVQNDRAVVSSGLKENDQVAVDGIMSLKDGAAVTTKQ